MELNREFLEKKYGKDKLKLLKEITSRNSKIKKIESSAFKGLTKLESIQLDYNEISEIESNSFDGLSNLSYLYLWNNKLKRIDSSLLKELKNLEELELNNNEIEHVSLENLSNLVDIQLRNNRLKRLESDTFKGLSKLKILNLENNEIESISVGSFESLVSLKVLKLNSNKLKRIERKCLESLKSIEVMQLYENEFKILSFFVPSTKLSDLCYDVDRLNEFGFLSEWNTFLQQFPRPETEKNSQPKRDSGLKEIQVDKIGKSKSFTKNDDEIEKPKPKTDKVTTQSPSHDSFERYEKVGELGSGSFGVVYKVLDKQTKIHKAMKMVNSSEEDAINEFEIMKIIKNENVVQYYEHFFHMQDYESKIFLITECCENGDLKKTISKRKYENRAFSEKEISEWMSQATNGLIYLHNRIEMIHRDIKPANMLLTKDNKLKLADFGLSKLLASGSIGRTYAGTPAYMSPELIRCKDDKATYSYKTDIWSLGCVLFELIHLRLAFAVRDERREKKDIPSFSESGRFRIVLERTIEIDPNIRVSSKELYWLLKKTTSNSQ